MDHSTDRPRSPCLAAAHYSTMTPLARLAIAFAASISVHAALIAGLSRATTPARYAAPQSTSVKVRLVQWQATTSEAPPQPAPQPPDPPPAVAPTAPDMPAKEAQPDTSIPVASTGTRYLSAREVDYPSEFRDPVDFEPLLGEAPVAAQTVRVAILVNAGGTVDDVEWLSEDVQDVVRERFTPYLLAQAFRPARLHGEAVASRMVLEFDLSPTQAAPDRDARRERPANAPPDGADLKP
ncbi:MAG: hypothetical protein QM639_06240 [Rhodocyclaceae bacterium]